MELGKAGSTQVINAPEVKDGPGAETKGPLDFAMIIVTAMRFR